MPLTLQDKPVVRQAGAPWLVPDAAAFLSISVPTIERHLRDGLIRSFKLGGRRLIADAELRRVAAGE